MKWAYRNQRNQKFRSFPEMSLCLDKQDSIKSVQKSAAGLRNLPKRWRHSAHVCDGVFEGIGFGTAGWVRSGGLFCGVCGGGFQSPFGTGVESSCFSQTMRRAVVRLMR